MPENTVDDIPRIVEAIRAGCSRHGLDLVDVSRKTIRNEEGYNRVVSNLELTRPVLVRWVDGFVTNDFLMKNCTDAHLVQPLVLLVFRGRNMEITEATKLPTENFHIFIRSLLTEGTNSTCIACMESVPDVIHCCTCCNYVFCSDCMIDAIDQNSQLPCPLCRCPDFWKNSFIGSMGSHPDLFAKFKNRHQHSDDVHARALVQMIDNTIAWGRQTRSN
jgi:hypothetical protein